VAPPSPPLLPAAHPPRGRFAPSPTGELHLGSAAAAIFCAARARAQGAVLVMRIEDIDTPRVVAGAEAALLDDLRWLGIAWDEGPDAGPAAPYRQSQRTALYQAAVESLAERGLTYLCDCSRAEIARVASAPHAGDEGPRYPGTCRAHGMRPRAFRRAPAVRLAVPAGGASRVVLEDAVLGRVEEDVAASVGDFVLRRGDGVFAYQLAVVADDLTMGITEVVRGADLASSAARQVLLARLLGGAPWSFAHLPLVVAPDGARLAKRGRGVTLREQRAAGRDPEELVRTIAAAYGHPLGPGDPHQRLAEALDLARLPRGPVGVDVLVAR
jgi:glutamyl-tRNA synthetase